MNEVEKKHFEEYIKIITDDQDYEIAEDDQVKEFSDGNKIGKFFINYALDIVKLFFIDSNYKDKVKYFRARGKIIEYIAFKSTRDIRDARNIVLDYLNDQKNKEDIIRSVSISMTEDGEFKKDLARLVYNEYYNYSEEKKYAKETYMNNGAFLYAASCEKLLKASLIFNEFIFSDKYNFTPDRSNFSKYKNKNNNVKELIIGSTSWRKWINDKKNYDIRNERNALEFVKEGIFLPKLDERANLQRQDLLETSGHSLYSFYKLLDPITKAIIGSEFYIYDVENPDNKRKNAAMLAVLKENLTYDKAGTKKTEDDLKKNSDQFVHARYADIDLTSVKPDELEFLKRLNTSISNYISYRFPTIKEHDKTDYNDDLKVLEGKNLPHLDKVTRHNFITYFSESEINKLEKDLINENKYHLGYLEQREMLHLAIFFKHYMVTRLNENIPFEDVVCDNLYKYFESIKGFDLFDGVSDNIFLNSFFTKENIDRLNEEIKNNSSNNNHGLDEVKEKKFENTEEEDLFVKNRFGYLRSLSQQEKDKITKELIEEVEKLTNITNNENDKYSYKDVYNELFDKYLSSKVTDDNKDKRISLLLDKLNELYEKTKHEKSSEDSNSEKKFITYHDKKHNKFRVFNVNNPSQAFMNAFGIVKDLFENDNNDNNSEKITFGQWIENQKQNIQNKSLTKEQKDALEFLEKKFGDIKQNKQNPFINQLTNESNFEKNNEEGIYDLLNNYNNNSKTKKIDDLKEVENKYDPYKVISDLYEKDFIQNNNSMKESLTLGEWIAKQDVKNKPLTKEQKDAIEFFRKKWDLPNYENNNNSENEKPAETVKDNLTQMEEMQKRIEELQKKIASQKEEIDYLNNLSSSKSDEIPRTEEKVISLDNNDLPSLNDIASSYIDASDDETFITPEDISNTPEPIVEIEDVNDSSVNFPEPVMANPEPVMANTVAEDTPNNVFDQDEDDSGLKR